MASPSFEMTAPDRDRRPPGAGTEPTPVREVMHPGVLCVDPDEPLVEAADTMNANAVSGLVVSRDEVIEGIVTTRDLLHALTRTGGDVAAASVRDAMTAPVVTVPPFTGVEDVLRAMAHKGLHRMPVAFEGRLVGMVTERDILDGFPQLAPVARSFDRELSTAHTDHTRVAGRCHACGRPHHDLRDVDDRWYCYECAGGIRVGGGSGGR